jgi:hypothetical protein
MPVDEFHRDVAAVALRAAGTHGFALGGGNALIAHQAQLGRGGGKILDGA